MQPSIIEVGEMNLLPDVDDEGVGGGRLDTRGTETGDKHVGCQRMTVVENNMVLDENKEVRTTPSMGQLTTLETGKPSLFLDNDTLSHRDVPGPMSLTGMDDMTRNLTEENPIIKEPVSEEQGYEAVMDDDLLSQPTQREGENFKMMKRMGRRLQSRNLRNVLILRQEDVRYMVRVPGRFL